MTQPEALTTLPVIDPTTPPGTLVVCCHHQRIVEILTEPAGNRSAYIDTAKPERERAIRHNAFRVLATWRSLPQPYLDAERAYDDARRAYDDAWLAYGDAWRAYDDARRAHDDARRAHGDAGRAHDDAWLAYDDAGRAYVDARRAYIDAGQAHLPAILEVVRAEHPDLPVDWRTGHLIFPGVL